MTTSLTLCPVLDFHSQIHSSYSAIWNKLLLVYAGHQLYWSMLVFPAGYTNVWHSDVVQAGLWTKCYRHYQGRKKLPGFLISRSCEDTQQKKQNKSPLKTSFTRTLALSVMNNELWEEEARAWRLEMRVCGVTALTRELFLKHRVRHSVWLDVRAYGQIDGSAQMFALVKNWGSGGMFAQKFFKKTPDKTTHISV